MYGDDYDNVLSTSFTYRGLLWDDSLSNFPDATNRTVESTGLSSSRN